MNLKMSRVIFASLILGSLAISTNSAMAWHDWRWSEREARWEHRSELQRRYRELEDARRQLDYDLRYGASRRRIAADEARIRDIEDNISVERRELARLNR